MPKKRKTGVTAAAQKRKDMHGAWLDNMKMDVGCSHCGYRKSAGALVYHHVDHSTKLFTISKSKTRSWKALLAEVAKCVVLCANCHTLEHERLRRLNDDQ